VRYALAAAGWILLAVLLVATAFSAALSFGAGTLGPDSGQGVRGDDAVVIAAALALVLGAALEAVYSFRPQFVAALLAPAAAAFLVAFFFNYDPYYAPALRRYSDGGLIAGSWIAFVAVAAVAAGVVTYVRPRTGAWLSAVLLFLILFTAFLVPAGH
jgi:hypothetical protein